MQAFDKSTSQIHATYFALKKLNAFNPINVRLPTISFPEFSSNYGNWFLFFETFDSVVNKYAALNNGQRFLLQGLVKGEAVQII